MDLEVLKKQNKLTVTDNKNIYVKPIDVHNFKTFPLKSLDGCLEVTPEQYLLLRANYYRFNKTLTELEINE